MTPETKGEADLEELRRRLDAFVRGDIGVRRKGEHLRTAARRPAAAAMLFQGHRSLAHIQKETRLHSTGIWDVAQRMMAAGLLPADWRPAYRWNGKVSDEVRDRILTALAENEAKPEGARLSDNAIGKTLGVSGTTVGAIAIASGRQPSERVRKRLERMRQNNSFSGPKGDHGERLSTLRAVVSMMLDEPGIKARPVHEAVGGGVSLSRVHRLMKEVREGHHDALVNAVRLEKAAPAPAPEPDETEAAFGASPQIEQPEPAAERPQETATLQSDDTLIARVRAAISGLEGEAAAINARMGDAEKRLAAEIAAYEAEARARFERENAADLESLYTVTAEIKRRRDALEVLEAIAGEPAAAPSARAEAPMVVEMRRISEETGSPAPVFNGARRDAVAPDAGDRAKRQKKRKKHTVLGRDEFMEKARAARQMAAAGIHKAKIGPLLGKSDKWANFAIKRLDQLEAETAKGGPS